MTTFNWRHTDWRGKEVLFTTVERQVVGKLSLYGSWNASYSYDESDFNFTSKGLFDTKVRITQDGNLLARLKMGSFGLPTLTLATGERFILSTDFWERELYWKTDRGEKCMIYHRPALSSMGKGMVYVKDGLAGEKARLLMSTGLYARKRVHYLITLAIAVIVPIVVVLG